MTFSYVWHDLRQEVVSWMICRIPIRDMTQSARPNQSCMFPYRKIDIEKIFYLSFSTNIQNHFPEIFILQNLILRTRSCGTGFITQCSWFFHFHLTTLVRWKCFVPQLYQFRRDISGGPALEYFYMIHRGGRWDDLFICETQLKRGVCEIARRIPICDMTQSCDVTFKIWDVTWYRK